MSWFKKVWHVLKPSSQQPDPYPSSPLVTLPSGLSLDTETSAQDGVQYTSWNTNWVSINTTSQTFQLTQDQLNALYQSLWTNGNLTLNQSAKFVNDSQFLSSHAFTQQQSCVSQPAPTSSPETCEDLLLLRVEI